MEMPNFKNARNLLELRIKDSNSEQKLGYSEILERLSGLDSSKNIVYSHTDFKSRLDKDVSEDDFRKGYSNPDYFGDYIESVFSNKTHTDFFKGKMEFFKGVFDNEYLFNVFMGDLGKFNLDNPGFFSGVSPVYFRGLPEHNISFYYRSKD